MIAYLYICSASFLYNGSDTLLEVCEKLKKFSLLYDYVWEYHHDDNKFCINPDQLSQILVYTGKTLSDILFNDQTPLCRQYRYLLLAALQKSISTKINTNDDLCEYLSLESADECQGIVVINQQADIPICNQVFSSILGWMKFRRHFLAKYPQSPEFFITEAKKYFPKLQFSVNICNRLDEVLTTHSYSIINGLSLLNDYCHKEWQNYHGNDVAFIDYFAKKYGVNGSFEGKKNKQFNAIFKRDDDQAIECYCEPHLKYNQDDCGNKRQYMRIYFQHPNASLDEKIYIGFIRKHI